MVYVCCEWVSQPENVVNLTEEHYTNFQQLPLLRRVQSESGCDVRLWSSQWYKKSLLTEVQSTSSLQEKMVSFVSFVSFVSSPWSKQNKRDCKFRAPVSRSRLWKGLGKTWSEWVCMQVHILIPNFCLLIASLISDGGGNNKGGGIGRCFPICCDYTRKIIGLLATYTENGALEMVHTLEYLTLGSTYCSFEWKLLSVSQILLWVNEWG